MKEWPIRDVGGSGMSNLLYFQRKPTKNTWRAIKTEERNLCSRIYFYGSINLIYDEYGIVGNSFISTASLGSSKTKGGWCDMKNQVVI